MMIRKILAVSFILPILITSYRNRKKVLWESAIITWLFRSLSTKIISGAYNFIQKKAQSGESIFLKPGQRELSHDFTHSSY